MGRWARGAHGAEELGAAVWGGVELAELGPDARAHFATAKRLADQLGDTDLGAWVAWRVGTEPRTSDPPRTGGVAWADLARD